MKNEKIKKNVFLVLSIIFLFVFFAGVMCQIMGENSPVKFIVNDKPVIIIIPSLLLFLFNFIMYRNSKKKVDKNI